MPKIKNMEVDKMEWPKQPNDWIRTVIWAVIMGIAFMVLGKFFDTYNIAEQTFKDIIIANASIVFVIPVVLELLDSALDDNDFASAYEHIPIQNKILRDIMGVGIALVAMYVLIITVGAQTITPGLLIIAVVYAIYFVVPETGDDMILLAFWIGSVATALLCGWISPSEWIHAQMWWLTTIWEWIQGHASMALGVMP